MSESEPPRRITVIGAANLDKPPSDSGDDGIDGLRGEFADLGAPLALAGSSEEAQRAWRVELKKFEQTKQELKEAQDTHRLRLVFAHLLFGMVCIWLFSVVGAVYLSGFEKYKSPHRLYNVHDRHCSWVVPCCRQMDVSK